MSVTRDFLRDIGVWHNLTQSQEGDPRLPELENKISIEPGEHREPCHVGQG
jgi:hypothetical protein